MCLTTSYYKAVEFKLGPRISWIQSDKMDAPLYQMKTVNPRLFFQNNRFFVNLGMLELFYRFQTLHDDLKVRFRKRINSIIVHLKHFAF